MAHYFNGTIGTNALRRYAGLLNKDQEVIGIPKVKVCCIPAPTYLWSFSTYVGTNLRRCRNVMDKHTQSVMTSFVH